MERFPRFYTHSVNRQRASTTPAAARQEDEVGYNDAQQHKRDEEGHRSIIRSASLAQSERWMSTPVRAARQRMRAVNAPSPSSLLWSMVMPTTTPAERPPKRAAAGKGCWRCSLGVGGGGGMITILQAAAMWWRVWREGQFRL
jgi:hypothetical protein